MEVELTTVGVLVLLGVGSVAGFINILAGGGALLSIPALIFAGLPETAANGTFRIAILTQNLTAVGGYQRAGLIRVESLRRFVPPTLIGALLGAWLGVQLGDAQFRALLIAVLLLAGGVVVFNPTARLTAAPREVPVSRWVRWPVFAAVGFYGGLVQAGVGYALLAALVGVGRLDLVRANVMKVIIVLAYTPIALVVFGFSGKVHVLAGAVVAAGHALGALVGVHTAIHRGVGMVRITILVAVVLASFKLSGLADWMLAHFHTP